MPNHEIITTAALAVALGKSVASQSGKALAEQLKSKLAMFKAGPQEQAIADWDKAIQRIQKLDLTTEQKADLETVKLLTATFKSALTREAEALSREAKVFHYASAELGDDDEVKVIEEDWIDEFLNNVRAVSAEEMLRLYGRMLAIEATMPGSYSKRAVAELRLFDKSDLETMSEVAAHSVFPVPTEPLSSMTPIYTYSLRSGFLIGIGGMSKGSKYFSNYEEAINLNLINFMYHKESFELDEHSRLQFVLSDRTPVTVANPRPEANVRLAFNLEGYHLTAVGTELCRLIAVPPEPYDLADQLRKHIQGGLEITAENEQLDDMINPRRR